MSNPSPLRYPGGKYKIRKLIELLVNKSNSRHKLYVEPFGGGAGVALDLLMRNIVTHIIINDYDRAIYSFWSACVDDSDALIYRILNTPVTIEEWHRQREIYRTSTGYSVDYAFATLFLNRTNHSGILSSGMIGGRKQDKLKLDVRFNKNAIVKKIEEIKRFRNMIVAFDRNWEELIRTWDSYVFFYLDPPYYEKGSMLYRHSFSYEQHKKLRQRLDSLKSPWALSYDDCEEIRELYRGVPYLTFSMNYSIANKGKGNEIMFFSEGLKPTMQEIRAIGMESMFEEFK